jgi:hypothetical protein
MSSVPTDHEADAGEPIRYPTNHVVGVVDTIAQVDALMPDLIGAGFADADVQVHSGAAQAEALDESTGRSGIANLAIRIAEKLGIENIEMERKELYEQAMRDGKFVVLVAAPDDEHKDRAAATLEKHGAHTVSFHGRFTIEGLVPPQEG